MPLVRTPGVYGLPNANRGYSQVIRATPNLVTFWPGTLSVSTSVSNYAMPATFSMECWVKITTVVANTGILSNWNTNGAMLWVDATNVRLKFHVQGSDIDSGLAPTVNTWYHLVGTYDGTSRSLYVNGSLMGGPTSGVTPAASNTPLITHNYVGSAQANLAGSITDAAIYSRALSTGEAVAHYNAGLPRV